MACLILNDPAKEFNSKAPPDPNAPALGSRQDSSTPHQPPHQQPCASAGNVVVSKKRSREAEQEFEFIPVNKKKRLGDNVKPAAKSVVVKPVVVKPAAKSVVVKPVVAKENFLTSCPHCSFEAMNPGILAIHVDREH